MVSAFVNGVAIDLAIHTGSSGFLGLAPDDWQKVFPSGEKHAHEVPTAGLGGEVQRLKAARVRTVALGTNIYTNSIASVLPNGKLSSVLGNQFLNQHIAAIDFPGRMLYLVPSQHFGDMQEYDMSGLKLIKAPPAGAITVYSVDVGSPAFGAGLRARDQVLAVNGQRAQLLGLKHVRQMLKERDGNEVTIEASCQGETKEFKFHLKRFL